SRPPLICCRYTTQPPTPGPAAHLCSTRHVTTRLPRLAIASTPSAATLRASLPSTRDITRPANAPRPPTRHPAARPHSPAHPRALLARAHLPTHLSAQLLLAAP